MGLYLFLAQLNPFLPCDLESDNKEMTDILQRKRAIEDNQGRRTDTLSQDANIGILRQS